MLDLKAKIKNYKERQLNTKALRSLVVGATGRIRLAGGTWLSVVKMSPAARLEIKRTK